MMVFSTIAPRSSVTSKLTEPEPREGFEIAIAVVLPPFGSMDTNIEAEVSIAPGGTIATLVRVPSLKVRVSVAIRPAMLPETRVTMADPVWVVSCAETGRLSVRTRNTAANHRCFRICMILQSRDHRWEPPLPVGEDARAKGEPDRAKPKFAKREPDRAKPKFAKREPDRAKPKFAKREPDR